MGWLRSEFIRNALAHAGVAFFAQGAVFLQKIALRRIMPQEAIGAWEFIFVVVGFFGAIDQVGRENCDILLMEPTVSRRHAQITVADGSVDVLDHGSTNGTQVDGAPLTAGASRTAKPGAVLRFGSATFVLTGPIDGLEPQQPAPVAHTSAGPPGAGGDTTAGPEGAVATNAIARLASQEGADILIAPGGSTIGRRATNTHVISGDPYVSGAHAELLADDTGVRLTDLGSTNGTVVNGRRLVAQEPVELADGDEVAFGQSRYVFEVLEDSGARDEEEWEDDELPTDFDELDAVNAAPPADPA